MLRAAVRADLEHDGHRVSRAMFEENLQKKLLEPLFRAAMTPLLRPGVGWDVDGAAEVVMTELVTRLPG